MKKNVIALAVAAAVAAPVAAMADTTLYGKAHVSFDAFSGDTASNENYTLSSNSSRLGVKGKEKLTDDLTAIFKYEVTVNMTESGDLFGGGRNTYVGLTGSWGTALMGRHDTPFKKVSRKYDLFGDEAGDSRAIMRGRGAVGKYNAETGLGTVGFDERTANTVAYVTPNMGGFSATIAYVTDWAADNNKFDAYSMSAGFKMDGLTIDAAYEQHNQADKPGAKSSEKGFRLGAGYSFSGFKVVGIYQRLDDVGFTDESANMFGIGGAYTFGQSTIKGQFYDAGTVGSKDGAQLWALGYDYKLSKQTKIYGQYAYMSNDSETAAYVVGSGTGHGTSASFDGRDGGDNGMFSVGVVHKF